MSPRTGRWLVILLAVGIPVVVVVTAKPIETTANADVAFPARCRSLFARVEAGPADKVVEEARSTATANDATVEERGCAARVVEALSALTPTAAGFIDRCGLGRALENRRALGAAAAVFELLRDDASLPDGACGTAGLSRVGPQLPQPACEAAGRLLGTGRATEASVFTVKALTDPTTGGADALCLERTALALRDQPTAEAAGKVLTDLRFGALPVGCRTPVGEALAGHIETARQQLLKLARSSANPDELACAQGTLQRLPGRPTVTDWTFEQANRVTRIVTDPVPGGPFAIAEGAKTQVTAVVWFLTVGMVLIALRQLVRWRRERVPGPVEIAPVAGSGDDKDAPVLAGLMRQRLAEAGVYPDPTASGVGELAVDVADVLGAAGDTGLFGSVLTAVKSALTVKVGYTLRSSIDHGGGEGPVKVLVQLDQLSTGKTVFIKTYQGATEREATTNAAFGSYLCLAGLPEVRRRTPSYLQWTTEAGLSLYQDALAHMDQGIYLTAEELLSSAARHEPANLLVHLELSDCNVALAKGSTADNALRSKLEVGDRFLKALVAALRAVQLNDHSTEAQSQLALVLSYVGSWQLTDQEQGSDTYREMVELLKLVEKNDAFVLPANPGKPAFKRAVLVLADKRWRMARRRTWWPWIIWVGGRLNRRRTVQGQLWPLRRRRHAVHDIVLAAEVSTRYDRMTGSPAAFGAPAWAQIRLWEVRFGRLLWLRRLPSDETTVQYNLAAAYARRAGFLAGVERRTSGGAYRYALECLDRSFTGVGRQLTEADLDGVLVDPDFDQLRRTPEFARWSRRFIHYDEVTAARDAWHRVFRTIAVRADAADRIWVERLGVPPARHCWDDAGSAWASSAAASLGDELLRWRTLASWAKNPAATKARTVFEGSTCDPPINQGRSVVGLADATLPGDSATTVAAMAKDNLVVLELVEFFAMSNEAVAQDHLQTMLDHVAGRNVVEVERVLGAAGAFFRERWRLLADWAARPSVW